LLNAPSIAAVYACFALLALAACAAESSSSDDGIAGRVVAVSPLHCTKPATQGNVVIPTDGSLVQHPDVVAQELSPALCEQGLDDATRRGERALFVAGFNVRHTVTVALHTGATFTVDVSADHLVSVGERYPFPP